MKLSLLITLLCSTIAFGMNNADQANFTVYGPQKTRINSVAPKTFVLMNPSSHETPIDTIIQVNESSIDFGFLDEIGATDYSSDSDSKVNSIKQNNFLLYNPTTKDFKQIDEIRNNRLNSLQELPLEALRYLHETEFILEDPSTGQSTVINSETKKSKRKKVQAPRALPSRLRQEKNEHLSEDAVNQPPAISIYPNAALNVPIYLEKPSVTYAKTNNDEIVDRDELLKRHLLALELEKSLATQRSTPTKTKTTKSHKLHDDITKRRVRQMTQEEENLCKEILNKSLQEAINKSPNTTIQFETEEI